LKNPEPVQNVSLKDGIWADCEIKVKLKNITIFILLAAVSLGASAGISMLIFQKLNVPFLLMGITTFGIGLSFNKVIRTLPGSYEVGNYFLLIFCLAMGSMANANELLGQVCTTFFL
jgi:hypothetical protein